MSSKEIVSNQDQILLALEECEKRIMSACRRGREATAAIGKELVKIRNEELFRARHENFTDYVTEDVHLDLASAYRIMKVYETVAALEQEGLMLPDNESQIVELAKLLPEGRATVWKRILVASQDHDRPITVDTVKIAVDQEEKRLAAKPAQEPAKSRQPRGVQVSLDMGEDEDEEKTNGSAPAVIALSEKGEAALARIRKICGDQVAEAIERARVQISERELRRWADLDNQLVYNLAHYVVNQRWSVAKAINYEERMIDGTTNVDTLITMSRARGGRLTTTHDDARILVEIMART
jgi:hypothetical protein